MCVTSKPGVAEEPGEVRLVGGVLAEVDVEQRALHVGLLDHRVVLERGERLFAVGDFELQDRVGGERSP